jgi:hypothetical protein
VGFFVCGLIAHTMAQTFLVGVSNLIAGRFRKKSKKRLPQLPNQRLTVLLLAALMQVFMQQAK